MRPLDPYTLRCRESDLKVRERERERKREREGGRGRERQKERERDAASRLLRPPLACERPQGTSTLNPRPYTP